MTHFSLFWNSGGGVVHPPRYADKRQLKIYVSSIIFNIGLSSTLISLTQTYIFAFFFGVKNVRIKLQAAFHFLAFLFFCSKEKAKRRD